MIPGKVIVSPLFLFIFPDISKIVHPGTDRAD
ncbi:unnamed protein product, partial [marine sediment metagenome]